MPIEQKDFELVVDSYLDDFADAVFSRSQENIVKMGISDTGSLLIGGNINRKFLEKEIIYPEQGIWIEYGTPPHPVSRKGRENIARWATRKLGLGEKEAESASWGIVNKIRQEGTQPRSFLRSSLDEILVRGF